MTATKRALSMKNVFDHDRCLAPSFACFSAESVPRQLSSPSNETFSPLDLFLMSVGRLFTEKWSTGELHASCRHCDATVTLRGAGLLQLYDDYEIWSHGASCCCLGATGDAA
jgi:hypothetical protein